MGKVGNPPLEPPVCEYLTCTGNKTPVLGTFSAEVWMTNLSTKAIITFDVWEDLVISWDLKQCAC